MNRAFVWIVPLLLLSGWCVPPAVDAVQEPRYLFNAYRNHVKLIAMPEQERHRQIFQNNLDHLDTIVLQIGGNVTIDLQDSMTVTILDGCGARLFNTTVSLETSGLTSEEAFTDVVIPVGIALDYGRYYMLEVSTLRASFIGGAKLVLNTDQASGRHVDRGALLVYPQKKQDILYYFAGTADSSKPVFPPWFDPDHPTNPVTPFNTNVMCPGRCIPLVPGEHAEYIAAFRFNVIIREQTATNKGSFWTDFQADPSLAILRENIRQMLEGDATIPGVREMAPYDEFYPFMNFYIALDDPANDPDSLRGFLHCANIDAAIDVVTGSLPTEAARLAEGCNGNPQMMSRGGGGCGAHFCTNSLAMGSPSWRTNMY